MNLVQLSLTAYYRIASNFEIKISLIFVKFRLAPLNENSLTSPKLEIQALLIASRLKVKILDEAEKNTKVCTFWADLKAILKLFLMKISVLQYT